MIRHTLRVMVGLVVIFTMLGMLAFFAAHPYFLGAAVVIGGAWVIGTLLIGSIKKQRPGS